MTNHPASEKSRLADRRLPIIAVLLILDSLHFVLARLLVSFMPATVAALYVMAIATVVVGLVGLGLGRIHLGNLRTSLLFFLLIGFLVGASTALGFEAVAFIDPGTASFLAKASILFGLGFSFIWLRERLTGVQIGGALIAVVGLVFLTFQPGDYFRLGALMMLGASFMYAMHTAVVKRYGGEFEIVEFLFFRLLCTTLFLLLFTTARQQLLWPDARAWPWLILVGTVDVAVSRTLYYVALRRIPLSLHTIVLALSPVAAVGWSMMLFGTAVTAQQVIGGAAVIAGVLIVTLNQER
jgi:drug/metabolite transporter (DMT)-like permease